LRTISSSSVVARASSIIEFYAFMHVCDIVHKLELFYAVSNNLRLFILLNVNFTKVAKCTFSSIAVMKRLIQRHQYSVRMKNELNMNQKKMLHSRLNVEADPENLLKNGFQECTRFQCWSNHKARDTIIATEHATPPQT
jgi:hypothetical protein